MGAVKNKNMYIPSTNIHLTSELITPSLGKMINEKILLFHKLNLRDASLAELVGQLSGFDFFTTKKDCGGFCDYINNRIALTSISSPFETKGSNFGLVLPAYKWEVKTVLHEIAHALQAKCELFEKQERLLSEELKIEWQAESIAYKLYNGCFGKLPYYYFNSYFSATDVMWLNNWYNGNIENDII